MKFSIISSFEISNSSSNEILINKINIGIPKISESLVDSQP